MLRVESGAVFCGLMVWLGFFAGWTVVSIPLTLAGTPFGTLLLALFCGSGGAWLGWRSRRTLAGILLVTPEPVKSLRSPSRGDLMAALAAGVGVLGATAFFIPTSDARPLWAVVLASAALVLWRTSDVRPDGPVRWSGPHAPSLAAVLLLALGIWLAYIFLLRPDSDDAFYLNLPIGIATAAHGMLEWDTMYGAAEWPVLGSNYRVEALQTLIAAIAWISGLSVAVVAHLVLPTLWCLTWAAALGVIGAGIFGRKWWVFAILAALSTLVFAGTLQNWGVHGVSRLFHGKAPLMLIVVPLLFIVTIRADILEVPLRKVIPLAAGLIMVGVGLTANALYIGPLALGLAVCAGWITRGFRKPRRLWVLTAVAPAMIVGLWLMFFDTPVTIAPDENRVFAHLALWDMFPDKLPLGLMAVTALCAILVGLLVPRGRIVTACLVSALLFVLNPFLWPLYDGSVTGGLNFRLWWAVPVPLVFAIFLAWTVIRFERLFWPFPVTIVALIALGFGPGGLAGMPGTQFALSLTKRPPERSKVAQEVIAVAHGEKVLAVEDIAAWLPTFEDHPPQVYVRQIYIDQNMTVVPAPDLDPRGVLASWINADSETELDGLSDALLHQCPQVIVISRQNPPHAFEAFLRRYDGTLTFEMHDYRTYEVSMPCG